MLHYILMTLLLINTTQIDQKQKVVFATNLRQDFPHLLGNTEKIAEVNPGLAIEILQLVAKESNIEISFKRMPWKRCFKYLEEGKVDAVFFAGYKEERERYGVFPTHDGKIDDAKAYSHALYFFYKLKNTSVTWDGNSLENFSGTIGTSLGYSISRYLENKNYTVEKSPRPLSDFKKLLKGRVNLVAALEHNGDYLLKKYPEFQESITKLDIPIMSNAYHLMFSHQFFEENKPVAIRIWQALEKVRTEHYTHLRQKYIDMEIADISSQE